MYALFYLDYLARILEVSLPVFYEALHLCKGPETHQGYLDSNFHRCPPQFRPHGYFQKWTSFELGDGPCFCDHRMSLVDVQTSTQWDHSRRLEMKEV